jgi:hypothetical protein
MARARHIRQVAQDPARGLAPTDATGPPTTPASVTGSPRVAADLLVVAGLPMEPRDLASPFAFHQAAGPDESNRALAGLPVVKGHHAQDSWRLRRKQVACLFEAGTDWSRDRRRPGHFAAVGAKRADLSPRKNRRIPGSRATRTDRRSGGILPSLSAGHAAGLRIHRPPSRQYQRLSRLPAATRHAVSCWCPRCPPFLFDVWM